MAQNYQVNMAQMLMLGKGGADLAASCRDKNENNATESIWASVSDSIDGEDDPA